MQRRALFLLVALLLIASLLAACSKGPTQEQLKFWERLVADNPQIYHFTDYDAFESFKGDHIGLIVAGLRHSSEVARWFAAEKSIEYMGQKGAESILKELQKISRDPNVEVASAVGLAENIFAGTYRALQRVTLARDGKTALVHRFQGAEYNDRQVWVVRDGVLSALVALDGSVGAGRFSEDSQWLAVTHGGRIWAGTTLVEVQTGKATDLLPWNYLDEEGYELDMSHPRPDPYVYPQEWRGSRLLLTYVYHDSNYESYRGYVVYDLEVGTFTRAFPPEKATDLIMTPADWNK